MASRFFGVAAALGITLLVFGFFFLVIWQFESQLPQQKPPPNEVTVNIIGSRPAANP
jgi:heme/copper-type cytochrome/quinol oxidase subunit 2